MKLLLPAGDAQVAVLERPDVTGAEPAVRGEDLGRRRGSPRVAGVSVMTTTEPLSSMIQRSCSAAEVSYTGTVTAPVARIA